MNLIKRFARLVQWGFVTLFVILGIVTISESLSITMGLLILGLICSPFGGKLFSKLIKTRSSQLPTRILAFALVFIFAVIQIGHEGTKDDYIDNRQAKLEKLNHLMAEKKFKEALEISEEYISAGVEDTKLIEIFKLPFFVLIHKLEMSLTSL